MKNQHKYTLFLLYLIYSIYINTNICHVRSYRYTIVFAVVKLKKSYLKEFEIILVIFIYLFIYITLPMNKQHITFTNIDNWQGTRYSLRQLQRPSI